MSFFFFLIQYLIQIKSFHVFRISSFLSFFFFFFTLQWSACVFLNYDFLRVASLSFEVVCHIGLLEWQLSNSCMDKHHGLLATDLFASDDLLFPLTSTTYYFHVRILDYVTINNYTTLKDWFQEFDYLITSSSLGLLPLLNISCDLQSTGTTFSLSLSFSHFPPNPA